MAEAELLAHLDEEGPFTVFAPTDSALRESPLTADLLSLEELESFLNYHVHEGELSTAELERVTAITTIDGPEIHVRFTLDGLELNDGVTLGSEMIEADNGYIHVIDRALIRPLITETVDYSREPDVEIPDATVEGFGEMLDSLTLEESGYIHDLRISLNIKHSNVSQLTVNLIHTRTDGEVKKFFLAYVPTVTGDDINLTLEDSAPLALVDEPASGPDGSQAFSQAAYRPDWPLENALGEPLAGDWTLEVTDYVQGEKGRLVAWSMSVTAGPELPAPALVFNLWGESLEVLPRGFTESFRTAFVQVGGLSGATLFAADVGDFAGETVVIEEGVDAATLLIPVPKDAERGIRTVRVSLASGDVSRIKLYDSLVVEPESKGIELLSHVPLKMLGVEWGLGSDVWGWTDPLTGAEIAIVGTHPGIAFVDVSTPEEPLVLGTLPTTTGSSLWHDMKVYQDHVFIVSEAFGHGMQIFDLKRLRDTVAPQTFGANVIVETVGKAHNIVINESSGFAYVVGGRNDDGCTGMRMYDLATPTAPEEGGCFMGGVPVGKAAGPDYPTDIYTHDAQCVTYTGPDLDYQGREICLTSDVDSLGIVDVTDKAAPVQLARAEYEGVVYAHQGWLTEDQSYFLLNDEGDEYYDGINTRSYVWDVRDLDAPELIGFIDSPSDAIGHNTYIEGQLAYQSNYTSGLRIVDISEIAEGRASEIAYYDMYPEDDFFFEATGSRARSHDLVPGRGITSSPPSRHPDLGEDGEKRFEGSWSNYPYFASGIIVVSDTNRGLFVLRPL